MSRIEIYDLKTRKPIDPRKSARSARIQFVRGAIDHSTFQQKVAHALAAELEMRMEKDMTRVFER